MSKSTSETLCSNLSHILHAASQPLTILRASLYKGSTDRMSIEELRELAASSVVQVERVCAFFGFLQEFTKLESVEPHISPTVLPLLVDNVVKGIDQLFNSGGVHLRVGMPDTCGPVLVDRERTSRALLTILLIAYSMARPKDLVELVCCFGQKSIRITVGNSHWNGDEMTDESRINMGICQAIFQSQQATLSWSLEPFTAVIELKKVPVLHAA